MTRFPLGPVGTCAGAILCLSAPLLAQGSSGDPLSVLLPGVTRLADFPAAGELLGHQFGERISNHAETLRFCQALAAASPRVELRFHGESVEGRELFHLLVSSPRRIAQLDAVQQGLAQLADPRGLEPALLEKRIAELPAVTWLAYSVHGDEISCTDAAMLLAWHLASADGDESVDRILAETIVAIDPLENPDGRDRFVFHARQTRGATPDRSPDAAERDQPWPGGRVNHHLFDMNRDWFALTQPETRARVKLFQDWWPHVFVDLHEMGANSSYYFAPPADPWNPEITAGQRDWLYRYGENNARWFDRQGYDYFVREAFDAFYPGYGEGWPTFHGSVGMTYEQASPRGLVVEREDGDLLTYQDAVDRHFTASLATCETTASDRQAVLRRFTGDRASAVAEGREGETKEFVFPPGSDPARTDRLMRQLAFQGIEVRRAVNAFTNERTREHGSPGASTRRFPAGSYVVRLDQPAKRLAFVLLTRTQSMGEDFLEEQRRRELKRQSAEVYDLTGWSLPLLHGVQCFETGRFSHSRSESSPGFEYVGLESAMQVEQLSRGEAPALAESVDADAVPSVAVVIPGGQLATFEVLSALWRAGATIDSNGKPMQLDGREVPRGSLIVKAARNDAKLLTHAIALGEHFGTGAIALDSSWAPDGASLGSNSVARLDQPRIALAWDRPASSGSAGATRYLLEERYGVPVTEIRCSRLGRANLADFDVVVLPNGGGYGSALGSSGGAALARFVRDGGTIVALGDGATRYCASEAVGLLRLNTESREKKENGNGSFDYETAIQPEDESPQRTLGALLRVTIDPEDPVGFGLPQSIAVVSTGRSIYTPIALDQGTNVGVYAERSNLLLSGFSFDEKLDQLSRKAWAVHVRSGRGHVVAFTGDPTFRAFADAMHGAFLNAVLTVHAR